MYLERRKKLKEQKVYNFTFRLAPQAFQYRLTRLSLRFLYQMDINVVVMRYFRVSIYSVINPNIKYPTNKNYKLRKLQWRWHKTKIVSFLMVLLHSCFHIITRRLQTREFNDYDTTMNMARNISSYFPKIVLIY